MKFKVFQGEAKYGALTHADAMADKRGTPRKSKPVAQFYFHVKSSNGKITLASEGYPTMAHAFRAVAQVWKSFGKAFNVATDLSGMYPIPYTRDSLKPPIKVRF